MRAHRGPPAGYAVATFPGYANVVEMATGAFATVYSAIEIGTGRSVALKLLRLVDTSPHLVEMFENELGALALLSNHPNVTTLYRTFMTPEGRPVLVLELCRGSLAQRVRQSGPMPPAEVVSVGVKIAGALETAHRSGLLHRDMKPQNMLVSQFDEPVLADFGVAALQAAAQATEGVFGFTTLHASPEALEGQHLAPSADIYGLASSMYQLLLGHGPFATFEGEAPASVILRILRDPAPRPPVTAMPIYLADLLGAALAKDPAMRPQSALAFAEALRDIETSAGWPLTPYVVWGEPTAQRAAQGLGPALAAVTQPHQSASPPAPPSQEDQAWLPRSRTEVSLEGSERTGAPNAPTAKRPEPARQPGTRAVLSPRAQERTVVTPVAMRDHEPTAHLPWAHSDSAMTGPAVTGPAPQNSWPAPGSPAVRWPAPGGPVPRHAYPAPPSAGRTRHSLSLAARVRGRRLTWLVLASTGATVALVGGISALFLAHLL